MGGDGGSIPGRQDLVKTKQKPEQAERHIERIARWLYCAITQEKLRQPIVSCELGRLYNKEAVLEFLLDKGSCESAQHLRSLKDIRELRLTNNPAFRGSDNKGDAYNDDQASPYICPVTGLEMSGRYRFCFLWSCGCVISEKAMKEVKSDVCHKCGGPYVPGDEVILNGTDGDIAELRERMLTRRAKAKADKKAKRAQKRKVDADKICVEAGPPQMEKNALQSKFQKSSKDSGKFNEVPSSSKGPRPLAAKKDPAHTGERKPEFDPKKSNVYKSLFLSKGDQQKQGPWVTYNPYYAMSGPS